ncbi:MAG: GGDEF domain-containing protein [Leptospiraceae bacterium]|nr:GGDEF domain-containing protein [Leptospiraceae bacterium]
MTAEESKAKTEAEHEIKRLRRLLGAYEKLTELSQSELQTADQIIRAQERVQDLSQAEIRKLHTEIDDLKTDARFQEKIKAVLKEDASNEALILAELENLRQHSDDGFYVDLFRVLLHHQFEAAQAQKLWNAILMHTAEMERALGRSIGFRVAMLDFLLHQNRIIKSPMIVEISLFEQMVKNALLDQLTGIYNRRFFDQFFEQEINRAARHHHNVALFFFDLDNFKQYNDQNGHRAGDEALQMIGTLMRLSFRREDMPCRFGGEEFAVILPETDTDGALLVANRFRQYVKEANFPGGSLTLSGGICHYPFHGQNPTELYLKVDAALYQAKEQGKDRILQCAPATEESD